MCVCLRVCSRLRHVRCAQAVRFAGDEVPTDLGESWVGIHDAMDMFTRALKQFRNGELTDTAKTEALTRFLQHDYETIAGSAVSWDLLIEDLLGVLGEANASRVPWVTEMRRLPQRCLPVHRLKDMRFDAKPWRRSGRGHIRRCRVPMLGTAADGAKGPFAVKFGDNTFTDGQMRGEKLFRVEAAVMTEMAEHSSIVRVYGVVSNYDKMDVGLPHSHTKYGLLMECG